MRPESITTLSPIERIQLIFDLVQEHPELYDDFKLHTAGEIFCCLQEVDNTEDIKKLKPEKRTQLLLKKTADLALEEKRPWQIYVAAIIWGISRPYFLAISKENKKVIPGGFQSINPRVPPAASSFNYKHILGFGLKVAFSSLK
jgi:hypothetical protein